MSYSISVCLDLGATAASLKAALASAGTIHATFKDVSTGFSEYKPGFYEFTTASIPDGYRGVIIFYSGTLGSDTNFNNVTVLSIASINPQEIENADAKTSSRNSVAPDNASITAIKAKTDLIPASPAAVSDIPSASANAVAVRSNLSTELGRIDVAISTRNAVAPDNTSITAIKAKTDNLPPSPAAVGSAMTLQSTERVKLDATQSDYAPAKAGDAMTLTSLERAAIVTAIETELANDATGGAFMQAIADKLAAEFDIEEVGINAIRDAILNRVVAGNHDTSGSVGKLLQSLPSSGQVNTTTPPTAASVASAVRTELSTELGRVDAAISTRNAVAPDNAGIASIKTQTDKIPNSPAAVTDIPSASTNAVAVRTELAVELARVDVATSTRNAVAPDNAKIESIRGMVEDLQPVASAIKERTDRLPDSPASNGSITISPEAIQEITDAVVEGVGDATDPWLTDLTEYPEDTAGGLVKKLGIGEPDSPVIVIPDVPVSTSVGRVYGFAEGLNNLPSVGADISFTLVTPGPITSEKIISSRKVVATTDNLGRVICNGNLFVELQRNDMLTPEGSHYILHSEALHIYNKQITIDQELINLKDLI